jgi:hypothetical protein
MNINFMNKYLWTVIIAFFAIIFLTEKSNAADPIACEKSGTNLLSRSYSDFTCLTQPTIQKVTFFRVDFFTSLPTAPTTTSPIGRSSCFTVFSNPAGSEVSIENGVGTIPQGTITPPPYGTYSHIIVEISNAIKYKGSYNFVNNVGAPVTMTDSILATGSSCWTSTAAGYTSPIYTWSTGEPVPTNFKCGSTPAPVEVISEMNSFNTSVPGSFLDNISDDDGTLLFLTDMNGLRKETGTITTDNGIFKIIGARPKSLNFTPEVTGYNLTWSNTLGLGIEFGDATNVSRARTAAFDFDLNLQ